MSEVSDVNSSNQHADDGVSNSVKSGSSGESASKQSEQIEIPPPSASAKSVILEANEVVQEPESPLLSLEAAQTGAAAEVAPEEQGKEAQRLENRNMSVKVVPTSTPDEQSPSKPDRVTPDAKNLVAPPETTPNPAPIEPVSLKPDETVQAIENQAEHPVARHEETKSTGNTTIASQLEAVSPKHSEVTDKDREHHPESEAQKDEDEDEDFLPYIKKRRFTFEDMSRPQRLISGLAIGQLLASALLILLNLLPHPLLKITTTMDGIPIGISAIVFVVALIFYILAWSFLLSGALHGHILLRILVLGAFSYVLIQTPVFGFMQRVRIILLMILWMWGLVIWLIEYPKARERKKQMQQATQGRHEQSSRQLQQDFLIRLDWGLYLPTFLPVCGLLIIYNILLLGYFIWFGVTGGIALSTTLPLFYAVVEIYMRSLTLLLIPVLFLAGTDFAEMGEAIARSGDTLVDRLHTRTPWPLALVIALVALLIIDRSLPAWTTNVGSWLASFFPQLAVGAGIFALLGGIVYLARLRRWPSLGVDDSALHIKTRLLVLATLLIIVLGIYVPGIIAVWLSYAQPSGTPTSSQVFTTYQQSTTQPNFSIAFPITWVYKVPKNDLNSTVVVFFDASTHPAGQFYVVRYLPGNNSFQDDLSQFLTVFCKPTCTVSSSQISTYGKWQVEPFTGQGKKGIAWMYDFNGQRWLLLGVTNQANFTQAEPIYTAMVNSWRDDLRAEVPHTIQKQRVDIKNIVNQLSSLLLVLVPLLAALLLAIPFMLRWRKRPDIVAVGAVFFLVLGVINLGYRFPDIVATISPLLHFDFSLSSILLTVSLATCIVLCWMFFKRKITKENTRFLSLLLTLNGGLGFVALMYWIYGLALESSKVENSKVENRIGVVLLQALLLLVALGWDIFTSGENTNKGEPNSPRHTRLLLFFGYTMLVATAVLYFSSQVVYPHPDQPLQELFFESENWPQLGLLFLGTPLVIATFILHASYWWGSRNEPTDEEKALPESSVSDEVKKLI